MAMDCSAICLNGPRNDQSIFQTLVITLSVIVSHVFGNGTP